MNTSSFEKELSLEIMRSERLRATLLALSFSIVAVLFLSASMFDNSDFFRLIRERGMAKWIALLLLGMVCYELLLRTVLGRLIRRGRRVPEPLRYWNAFLETSIPSVGIITFAEAVDPVYALVSIVSSFYFIFIVLSTLRVDVRLSVFTGIVAGLEFGCISTWYASSFNDPTLHPMLRSDIVYYARAVVIVIAGGVAGFVATHVRKFIVHSLQTMEERNEIVRVFGQQVSPAVVDELLNSKADASTTRKYVCVMFVDIRGFTQFAEKREPEEIVSYLNTLFEFMIEIVNRHHGIIHQLLGDGFMAIFGAPLSHGNDTNNAVLAASEILEHLNNASASGTIPPTRIGIGLHAGEVVAGTVGSSLHKEYKVTGDVVNLASRIEQLNKEFNTQVLASGDVWRALGEHDVRGISLGAVQVKGRELPVEIFELAK